MAVTHAMQFHRVISKNNPGNFRGGRLGTHYQIGEGCPDHGQKTFHTGKCEVESLRKSVGFNYCPLGKWERN